MQRRVLLAIAGIGLAMAFGQQAYGQNYPTNIGAPVDRPKPPTFTPYNYGPTLSPYLNLLRIGNPAVNYYGLVRPELEFRANDARIFGDLNSIQHRLSAPATPVREKKSDESPRFSSTGHPVTFMNKAPYYRTPNRR